MNSKGTTILELLVSLYILSIIIIFSGTSIKAYLSRIEINTGLRQIILSLNTARYLSINLNKRIKVEIEEANIILKNCKNDEWQEVKRYYFPDNLSLKISATPFFYPHGEIVPLFSITLENKNHSYKISCSIAGRLKVKKQWKF
jgi:hypothetical protein